MLEALSPLTSPDAHLPVWVFMTAHELVRAHQYGGSRATAVRVIDARSARLLGFTGHGLGVGERVEAMAGFWVGRVRAHGDSRARAALVTAVAAYDAHLETLSEMSTGDAC
ncbi:hypothetical protein ACTD5D_40475 [Nocardia takedensis]|uniref:hypothetical protein n=1 Tax=Nocardia takedensis TaxID=259390 RepID=UPI003F76B3BC